MDSSIVNLLPPFQIRMINRVGFERGAVRRGEARSATAGFVLGDRGTLSVVNDADTPRVRRDGA